MKRSFLRRSAAGVLFSAILSLAAGGGTSLLGSCGPFTDFTDAVFCPFVLEIFYLGITTGTTPTTYDPTSSVSRLQMAAFLSRSVDGVLNRGSRRAALGQFWTPQSSDALSITTVADNPEQLVSDGLDIWVAEYTPGNVKRIRASDARVLETWTGGNSNFGMVIAMGRVFSTGQSSPGRLYRINPGLAAGAMETVASNLPNLPSQVVFDGGRLWVANLSGSVSIVTPGVSIPWTVTTVSSGEAQDLGMAWDGSNIWVSQTVGPLQGVVRKLSAAGAVLQTVTVGGVPDLLMFDGNNLWVPNNSDGTVSVVRASSGVVLATLSGNGLSDPRMAAFDGKRVLVTSQNGQTLSLWKAADLSPLGFVSTPAPGGPVEACSDGINFWISIEDSNRIARF